MPVKRGKDGVGRYFHHQPKQDGTMGLVQVKKEHYTGTPERKSILPHYLSHGGLGPDEFPYAFSGAKHTNIWNRNWEKHHYPLGKKTRGPLRWKLVPGESRRRRKKTTTTRPRATTTRPRATTTRPRATRKRTVKEKWKLPAWDNHGGLGPDEYPYAFSGAKHTNIWARDWEKHHYPLGNKTRGPLRWKMVPDQSRRRNRLS